MEKVLTGDLTFKSLVPCDLSRCTKSEILAYFENSYNLNESLFTALKDESVFYKCPDRLRLPLIFYYGHTACVYMNKLILAGLLKPEDRVNLHYETLFETGVDEMSWDDTENYRMGGQMKWPQLDNVIEYRRKVRHIIVNLINSTPLTLPVTETSPWWGMFMGMDHERIHIETSSVLIHQLPIDLVTCPPTWTYAPSAAVTEPGDNVMIPLEAQDTSFGKPRDFPSFGWDNEYGSVTCKVPAFEASKYPISNRAFLEFVEAGGYQSQEYWSSEGWKWAQFRQAKHPTFWVCPQGCKSGCGSDLAGYSHCKPEGHLVNGQNGYRNGHSQVDGNGHQGYDEGGGQYRLRAMFDVISMPWDWPVEVNYHEAKAYCAWKGEGYRLPCEAEFNIIKAPQGDVSEGTSSDIAFLENPSANLQLQFGSSSPVNYYPANALGFHDTMGNVWEWGEDHFNGLPGFNTCHLYDDFSSPCFDGRHTVIMGGSWISSASAASRFGRYAFRRHFFQHCGFRLVRSLAPPEESKLDLPVRFINTEIFVLGDGPIEKETGLDDQKVDAVHVASTNSQYTWESEAQLNHMLHQEYSTDNPHCLKWVELVKQWVRDTGVARDRALHMGCGTGRASVSLGELFDDMLAQDFVARFIDACLQMQAGKAVKYTLEDVSKLTEQEASFPASTLLANITFKLMTWLPNEVGFFDFVCCSFFDRVQNIKSWTVRLPEILNPEGLAVIVSHEYDKNKLIPLFANRLEPKLSAEIEASDGKTSHVTAWRHCPN